MKKLLIVLSIGFSFSHTVQKRSIETFMSETEALVGELVNKLPCDLPTSIHKNDIPFTISQSGYYCLADDLGEGTPASINVQASNVVINLSGHTLDLANTGTAGITISGCTNVTIMNGLIQNGATNGSGIQILKGSQKIALNNITITNCPTAILVQDASSVVIKNCLCQQGQTGIVCSAVTENASDFVIAQCSILNNTAAGIQLTASTNTVLSEPKIKDCHIINSTLNTSTTNPTYGIQINETRGVSISDTTIDTTTYGVYCTNTCNLRASASKILNCGADGICITELSNGAYLQNYIQGYSFDNLIIDMCNGNNVYCMSANKIALRNCHLLNAQQSAFYQTGCFLTSLDSCTCSNSPASGSPILTLGDTSDFSDTIRVSRCVIQNNLSGGNLNGIQVTQALNVIIEHSTISTNGVAPDYNGSGILVVGDIGNCKISHCAIIGSSSNGISYANANTTGSGLVIDTCDILGQTNNGIYVTQSANCIIKNSTISCTDTGINITGGEGVTINNNIIQNCSSFGINLDLMSGCGIRGNTICQIADIINGNGIGINNLALTNSKIYHNFAYQNDTNYVNVPLVVSPAPGIGAHENLED